MSRAILSKTIKASSILPGATLHSLLFKSQAVKRPPSWVFLSLLTQLLPAKALDSYGSAAFSSSLALVKSLSQTSGSTAFLQESQLFSTVVGLVVPDVS